MSASERNYRLSFFRYTACEESGRKIQGVLEAPDRAAAVATLSHRGVHILDVREQKNGAAAKTSAGSRKVTRSDLALFTRRLADLSAAGLPLDRAVSLAGEQSDSARLRTVCHEAVNDVHSGLPVSEALAKHGDLFPTMYTMTLRAGEASGQFPEVATKLAELQQLEVRRRSEITGALLYPSILVCASVCVVGFMEFFVVPKLAPVFDSLGSELPASTAVLLGVSSAVVDHWLPILIIAALAVFGYRTWSRSAAAKNFRDRVALKIPLIGGIIEKAVISRYARVLGTLLYGGVPILESLKIAGAATGNKLFEQSSTAVQGDVRDGKRLADAMTETGAFSNVLVQMVAVGEETGDLPRMLGRVSETLDFEVDQSMSKLTTLMEPIIVMTAGLFIGFIVLSILLPIYQAQDLIK